MKKYSVLVIFPVLFAAVAAFNVNTTVTDGVGSSVDELLKPFTKIGENYYLVERSVTRTWIDAAHYCRTQGAHLASIETEDEWNSLISYLESQGYKTDYHLWIGGNDINELFKFVWISSGQPMTFTKWLEGEPNNLNGHEHCVEVWKKGDTIGMNDLHCGEKMNYICKADIPKTITVTVW